MKDSKNVTLIAAVVLGMFVSVLAGCGGGGGGGGDTPAPSPAPSTEASLSATNAPQAGSAVLQAANIVGAASAIGAYQPAGASSGTASHYTSPVLIALYEQAVSFANSQKSKSEIQIAGSRGPITETCDGGGTVSISATWTGPDNPTNASQVVDFRGNMTYSSCREDTHTLNGSASIAFEGPLSAFTKLTFSASNVSYSDTVNSDMLTFTNVSIVFSDFAFTNGKLTDASITLSGGLSGTAHGAPLSIECDGYKMVFNSGGGGTAVSMSGRIKPACLGGWVTVSTNIPLFVPTGANCPTAGEVIVASRGNSAKTVAALDSKITVYFNSVPVQTYNSCKDVEGLCAG